MPEAPVCGECLGHKKIKIRSRDRIPKKICPSCNGTGLSPICYSANKVQIHPGLEGYFRKKYGNKYHKLTGKVYTITSFRDKLSVNVILKPLSKSSSNHGFHSIRPEKFYAIGEKGEKKANRRKHPKKTTGATRKRTKKTD